MSHFRMVLSSHKHVIVGILFLLLSSSVSYTAWKNSPASSDVLGSQTLLAQDALQQQPQQMEGGAPSQEQTVLQQMNSQQTSPSQETSGPAQGQGASSTDTPSLPSSQTPTTEIVITDPTIEIEIDNTDTTLVITDASSDTPIVSVPTTPTIGYDEGGALMPSSPTLNPTTSPTSTAGTSQPRIEAQIPGVVTTIHATPALTTSQNSRVSVTSVIQAIHKPLSYVGIRMGEAKSDVPQSSKVSISYRPTSQNINLDALLKDYQFQVWAVGDSTLALYRNGITTYTTDAVKLGLSKLTFKLVTDTGDVPIIYYPDTVWSYLADIREISRDTHTVPIQLLSDNGVLTYHITAHSRKMLFAALPVKVCRSLVVRVDSRKIESTSPCTRWDKMLDSISLAL